MMRPKYRCPQCGAESFEVTAHVTQGWKIDCYGVFIECTEECEEVTHQPDEDDMWYCANCEFSGPGQKFLISEAEVEK